MAYAYAGKFSQSGFSVVCNGNNSGYISRGGFSGFKANERVHRPDRAAQGQNTVKSQVRLGGGKAL